MTTDLAIETQWGDELGAIVSDGPTQVLGGEPRSFEQLLAPLDGILRGFVHDGVAVDEGAKVLEVDPRNDLSKVFGIGPRPRRIAEGVLAAIEGKRGGVS